MPTNGVGKPVFGCLVRVGQTPQKNHGPFGVLSPVNALLCVPNLIWHQMLREGGNKRALPSDFRMIKPRLDYCTPCAQKAA